jgi:tetratricopeptide (TPR) repeat protein
MKLSGALLIPFILLLAACASNDMGGSASPRSSSTPTYSSIYYFTTGALEFYNGYYNTALGRFTKASQNDPESGYIRKHIILSSIYLFSDGETDVQSVKAILKENQQFISLDEETLEAVHGFYNDVSDTTGLLTTIKTWQEKRPGPRPYILRYIYEFKFRETADPQWLYTALDMAWNDPSNLSVLGRFLMLLEDPKALDALIRLHQISPDPEGEEMLARQLFSDPDSLAVADFFLKLNYQENKELMLYISDWALSLDHPVFFAAVADRVLALKDPDILEYLVLYALYNNDARLLNMFLPQALAYDSDPRSETRIILAGTAISLYNGIYDPVPGLLGKLRSSIEYDLVPEYYSAIYTSARTDTTEVAWEDIIHSMGGHISKALPDNPIRDYLLWHSVPNDSLHAQLYAGNRAALILYLMEDGRIAPEDIDYLAGYYAANGELNDRIDLLRRGVELFPDSADILNNLGYSMLISHMDREEAAGYIGRAVALDPTNPFFLDSLAWYHYLEGNYSKALELMQIPLGMENLPGEIAYHGALIYMRLNDFEMAKALMREVIRLDDDPSYVEKATQALIIWGD